MAPRYESLMNNELNRFWGINYVDFVCRLLDEFYPKNNDLILDIATGTSFIPSFLIKNNKKFARIIGLDLTFGMLLNGKKKLGETNSFNNQVLLVCASAHQMPFQPDLFDHAICCLATHHMEARFLLANIEHSLKEGGSLHIADAGASSNWKNKTIQIVIKTAAFLYFLFSENLSRALAESAAIGNIHTSQEWKDMIESHGFSKIEIEKLKSKKFWAPDPIFIKALKKTKGEK
jgi:ubiquinone/menaquinone biosynthesis C-methylase UbiE